MTLFNWNDIKVAYFSLHLLAYPTNTDRCAKREAQANFVKAFLRWKNQTPDPVPNYRYPNSQGPQDTQGRDKGLNPYDNPPIKDWKQNSYEGASI